MLEKQQTKKVFRVFLKFMKSDFRIFLQQYVKWKPDVHSKCKAINGLDGEFHKQQRQPTVFFLNVSLLF
jgi:hypothetical protein